MIFEYGFVAETAGLSEREKKALYLPGAEFGRSLLPGEEIDEPGSPSLSYFSGQSGPSSNLASSNRKIGFSEAIEMSRQTDSDKR